MSAYFGGHYGYSRSSTGKLLTCIEPIRVMALELIKHVDVKIEYGIRDQITQDELYNKGWSQKKWPGSKHNSPNLQVLTNPETMAENEKSRAVDISPYFGHLHPKVDWRDNEQSRAKFYVLAGTIMQVIRNLKKEGKLPHDQYVRWGGDWNMNGDMGDQTFHDLGHWEMG